MTVVITDTRTLVDHADTLTDWSSPAGGETLEIFTSEPDPVEASGCIGMAISEETGECLHTLAGAVDLTNQLVYVWVLVNGSMDNILTGGIGIVLLDASGPDEIAYHVAGSDVAGFRHSEGPVGWQCVILDGAIKTAVPGDFTVLAGAEGTLDFANVTGIGAYYSVASKAVGGADNCFTDTIRFGNNGLVIAGGVTGARGSFDEIAIEDRSTADGTAYGICHEVASGVFGLQGPLTFGLAVGDAEHWFQDTNVTIIFEDRNIGTTRYFFDIAANTDDVGHFQLGLVSGSDGGTDGCSVLVPAGVGASMDFSDPDMDTINLYASTFTGFDAGVLFSTDATNGITHEIFACTFLLCGTINPGRVEMRNCSISGSPADVAMDILDNLNTLIRDISFLSAGTGHAIDYRPTGAGPHTLDLIGFNYAGYAGSDGSTGNEVLLYNPVTLDADATIVITGGGGSPTIMLAPSVTGVVTIDNPKTLIIDNIETDSDVKILDTNKTILDGTEDINNSSVRTILIATAGTGYLADDVLTVSTGTFSTVAQIRVETVGGGGEILTTSIEVAGDYSVNPDSPAGHTGGTGSGGTFVLTMKGSFAYQFTFAPDTTITIVVFHLNFKDLRFNTILQNADQTIPVQQIIDRTYVNP